MQMIIWTFAVRREQKDLIFNTLGVDIHIFLVNMVELLNDVILKLIIRKLFTCVSGSI